MPGIDNLARFSLIQEVLVDPGLVVPGHQPVKLTEVTHQLSIALYQFLQTAAFQMGPHWPIEQNVAAEKYSVSPIQETNVIRRFTRRVNHLKVLAPKTQPLAIAKPVSDLKRWYMEAA